MISKTEIQQYYMGNALALDFNAIPSNTNNGSAAARLDRNTTIRNLKANHNWHDNMCRLVASYVSEGKSDPEIHDVTTHFTAPGYTDSQTIRDVEIMIKGAREKGFGQGVRHREKSSTHILPKKRLLEHIADIELTTPEFLIEDILEKKSVSELFGASGSGKSFIAIDMACCISNGKPFHSFETTKGSVIYVAGEGRRGVVRRIYAWTQFHNAEVRDLSLFVSRKSVGFRNPDDLNNLKSELRELRLIEINPSLIIIDTLARNFGEGDENNTADMSGFIAAIDDMNDEFECATLIVHHSGHGDKGRSRGSSALKGALDSEYMITKDADRVYMKCTKMKDDEGPAPLAFYLIPVELKDKDGDPIPCAVLEFRGEHTTKSFRLTPTLAYAYQTFNEAAADKGQTVFDNTPRQVELEEWRKVFYRKSTQENQEAKRKAFERARKDLVLKGFLSVENDIYTARSLTGHVPDIDQTSLGASGSRDPDGQDTSLEVSDVPQDAYLQVP